MAQRLVNWDSLEMTIDGGRLERLARERVAESGAPIENLQMGFFDSLLTIRGTIRKVIPIPFVIEIERMDPNGNEMTVPIASISAAGLPVPRLLTTLFEATAAKGAVRFEGNSVVVRLDRFLPDFVDVEIAEARITGDGIIVRTGSGGADPPDSGG